MSFRKRALFVGSALFFSAFAAPALATCIPAGGWSAGTFHDGVPLCAADLNNNNAFLASQFSPGALLTVPNTWTARQTFTGITLSNITGLTQCIDVNTSGIVSGAGSNCLLGSNNLGDVGSPSTALNNLSGLPHFATTTAVAALAHTAYTVVVRDGYSVAGDAPPLMYLFSGANCSLNSGSGDNGSQIPLAGGGCANAVFPSGPWDMREFGVSTASSDNTAAVNTALAAAKALSSVGGALTFGVAGGFTFTGAPAVTLPNSTYSLDISGVGAGVTVLHFTGTNGLVLTESSFANGVHLHDFSETTNKTGGGKGISIIQTAISANAGNAALNSIRNVTMYGADGQEQSDYWTDAIDVFKASNFDIENVLITCAGTPLGNAIHFAGDNTQLAVVMNLTDVTVLGCDRQYWVDTYAQGFASHHINGTGGNHGVYVPDGNNVAQVSIVGSQFNNKIDDVYANGVIDLSIIGNTFYPLANSAVEIHIVNEAGCTITGNNFDFVTGSGFTNTAGVEIDSEITPCVINTNSYFRLALGNWFPLAGTFATKLGPNIYDPSLTIGPVGIGASTFVVSDAPENVAELPTCNATFAGYVVPYIVDNTATGFGATLGGGGGGASQSARCNKVHWVLTGP